MATTRLSAAAGAMAREAMANIGREVLLARTNAGLSRRAAARLAGLSPATLRSVELGKASVRIGTACRVSAAVGLKVWAKAFPVGGPSLRDTGQLRLAERLKSLSHAALRVVFEVPLGGRRSVDVVVFGPTEIVAIEIYRLIADLQAQYRSAAGKRDELAASHHRPVRLVLALEDTQHNRTLMREHASAVVTMLPAGSREILRSLRSGEPLGRDGLLWLRAR